MKRSELSAERTKLKMTQEDVAKKAGIQRSYYGLIENGQRNPTLSVAINIAEALETTLKKVFPKEIFFAEKCYISKQ